MIKAANVKIEELARHFDPHMSIKQGFTVKACLKLTDGSFDSRYFDHNEWADLLRADNDRLAKTLEYIDRPDTAAAWAIRNFN
jgi:hypothetical protein